LPVAELSAIRGDLPSGTTFDPRALLDGFV
jgi:hypothetical protein